MWHRPTAAEQRAGGAAQTAAVFSLVIAVAVNYPVENNAGLWSGTVAERLAPPHDLPHVLLPPQQTPVSGTPSATDAIVRKYEQGIEFADQMGEITGLLAIICLPMGLLTVISILSIDEFLAWFTALEIALLVVCLILIREDFSGQKYNPVLFDQATGQVHVMDTKPLTWPQFFFMPWKAAGDQVISSFDWRCARAEVVSMQVFQGQIMRTEHNLVLAFTEAPDSNKVVYRTGVGTTTAYDNGLGCINRWEHIRRYMRGEGPGLRGWDRPWGLDAPTLWHGLFYMQVLLGPGSGAAWRSKKWRVYADGLVTILLLPISMYIGVVRWACYAARRQPEWPQNSVLVARFNEKQRIHYRLLALPNGQQCGLAPIVLAQGLAPGGEVEAEKDEESGPDGTLPIS